MLEPSDLQAIAELISASEGRMTQKIEGVEMRLTLMVENVEKSLKETERMLLDEIERNRTYLEGRMKSLQENLDNIEQYYKIKKLEDGNNMLEQKMLFDLSQRVAALEARLA